MAKIQERYGKWWLGTWDVDRQVFKPQISYSSYTEAHDALVFALSEKRQ